MFCSAFWRKVLARKKNTLNIKVLLHNKLSEARTQRLMILEKFPKICQIPEPPPSGEGVLENRFDNSRTQWAKMDDHPGANGERLFMTELELGPGQKSKRV